METKICGDEKTRPRFPACKFVRFGANCGMSSPALLIDSRDTLAVALRDLPAGEKVKVAGRDVLLVEPIAAKHKFTLDPMQPGDTALMYGVTVGRALRPIPLGRKNWIFCWTELGAEHLGIIQSLISTCRLHDVNPYTYLVDVLQRISQHPASEVADLTPRRWKLRFADQPLRSLVDPRHPQRQASEPEELIRAY